MSREALPSTQRLQYCDLCKQFRLDLSYDDLSLQLTIGGEMKHFTYRVDLLDRHGAGCTVCGLLLEAMQASLCALEPEPTGLTPSSLCIRRVDGHGLRFLVCHRAPGERSDLGVVLTSFEIFCAKESTSPCASIPVRDVAALPPKLDDPQCFELAKHWLASCEQSHEACRNEKPSLLPARVIDVGDGIATSYCRLRVSAEKERHDYLALSHCWGDASTVSRTTRANYGQYQESIPIGELSRTFEDAVSITRELGYRYLWVDALCIIQDDVEDWEREAVKMAGVYGKAHLTIAASSSVDGSAGILNTRQGGEKTLLSRASETLGTELIVVYGLSHKLLLGLTGRAKRDLSDRGQVADNSVPTFIGLESPPEPLLSRKWCFQERLLSRRILYYSADELVWECRQSLDCECGFPPTQTSRSVRKGDNPSASHKLAFDALFHNPASFQPIMGDITDDQRALTIWKSLITTYSDAHLTDATDVFPAISGIVEKIFPHCPGNYVAGAFTSHLLILLTWYSDPSPSADHVRPATYCAPAWSWASVQGRVGFAHDPSDPHHDRANPYHSSTVYDATKSLVDLERSPSAGNYAYGRVCFALVTLLARALPVTIRENSALNPWRAGPTSRLRPTVLFDGIEGSYHLKLDTYADAVGLEGKTVWVLVLCADQGDGHKGDTTFFLLLQEVEGEREGEKEQQFRRIGVIWDHGRATDRAIYRALDGVPRAKYHLC